MKNRNIKKYRILRQSVMISIIFFSIVVSINAASAVDKTYYWTPSSGAIGSSGFTADWGNCNAKPTSYRITTLTSTGFTCLSDYLTKTTSGDQYLAIYPTAYSSDTKIAGKTGATFYLSSQKAGYTATYRFDMGYAVGGTFTSLGYVTQSSYKGKNNIINLSNISGTAPAGSYLALKVSVTTSKGGRVNLGTNGGSTGSNSGRFYVTETAAAPTPLNGTSLTNITPLTQSTVASVNATYVLNLTNTGSLTDNYILTTSNSGSALIGLNISSPVMLASGASQIFRLNVTKASAGK
ncbi:MAG: hypothetical protein O8C66_09155, partial [Candidatus Methanoperedens sp.]|nr:hypothetical protein [Candidatus Methanoperedens sp.]